MQEKSIRERLNEMFTRYNYVGICNITSQPFKWTVALEQNEILNMGPADHMSEDEMSRKTSGSFLPTEGVMRQKQKVVEYSLEPGEKKIVPGEAAYVLIDKIFRFAIREKYGSDKSGLSKLVVPKYQDEMLPKIIVGPVVKNVGQVLNDFIGNMQDNIEGFSSVQAYEPPTLNTDSIMGDGEDLSTQPKLHVKSTENKARN